MTTGRSCNPLPLNVEKKPNLGFASKEMQNTVIVPPSLSEHEPEVVVAKANEGSVRVCVKILISIT